MAFVWAVGEFSCKGYGPVKAYSENVAVQIIKVFVRIRNATATAPIVVENVFPDFNDRGLFICTAMQLHEVIHAELSPVQREVDTSCVLLRRP